MNGIVFESSPNKYSSLWLSFASQKMSNGEVKLTIANCNSANCKSLSSSIVQQNLFEYLYIYTNI